MNRSNTFENKIYIFTDGNCKSNGKKYARAGYGVFFTGDEESKLYHLNSFCEVEGKQTNQVAELTAIKTAFSIVLENKSLLNNAPIEICTDSMYSINCLTVWYKSWESNGWKNAKRQSVKNKELIKEILDLKIKLALNKIPVSFRYVQAHREEPSTHDKFKYFLWYGNNQVDSMINQMLD